MVTEQEIHFPPTDGSDRQLHGSLFVPDKPHRGRGMLFMHGYKSNSSGYAEYAQEAAEAAGAIALTLDFGGHGDSEGDREALSITDHLAEARAAYLRLANDPRISRNRIGICGSSFGALQGALLSAEVPVKGLLLRAPALFPDGMDNVPRGEYDTSAINQFRERPGYNNPGMRAITNFAGHLVLVGSEQDEFIPQSVINTYESASSMRHGGENTERHTIPGARHSLDPRQRQVFKGIVSNFARNL
jgi:pimeloyl-ACP methyl ester carboxylesterase